MLSAFTSMISFYKPNTLSTVKFQSPRGGSRGTERLIMSPRTHRLGFEPRLAGTPAVKEHTAPAVALLELHKDRSLDPLVCTTALSLACSEH